MRISIAMATFDGARHLREQLDSLAAQSRLPDQLVITDDRSSDETVEVARAFAAVAPFEVRIEVNPKRLGVAANFDRALSMCDGDLVFLCDQDDVWFPEKLETVATAALAEPIVGCWMCDAMLADGDLVANGRTKLGNIRASGLPDTWMVMGCCAAFRRELLELLLPIPANQPAHDNWLVQVADLMGLVRRLELPMQFYRRHGSNVSQVGVNRLERPPFAEKIRNRLSDLFRRLRSFDGLRIEKALLDAAVARMHDRPARMAMLLGERAGNVVATSRLRASLLARRMDIREQAMHRRPFAILALARDGGYGTVGGFQGAMKDLLFQ